MNGFSVWDGYQFDSVATNWILNPAFVQIIYNGKIYGSRQFNDLYDPGIELGYVEDQVWHPIEGSPNFGVECAYVVNNLMYLGGGFLECGGGDCFMVCSFDGETFIPLVTNGFVESGWRALDLTFFQNHLILGGSFKMMDENGEDVWHLGIVNDGWLQEFYSPLSGASIVEALQVYNGDLYIGGFITPEGNDSYHTIMKWDGNNLSDLSSFDYGGVKGPFNARVTDMEVYNDKLYVAGWFDQLEGEPCQGVASWDGSSWECLNTETISPLLNSVSDIEIVNDTLYLAGDFVTIGEDTMNCIARLNQSLTKVREQQYRPELSFSPNPASTTLTIQSTSQFTRTTILDLAGRELYSESFNSSKRAVLSIERLSPGIYILSVQTEGGTVCTRFVKE